MKTSRRPIRTTRSTTAVRRRPARLTGLDEEMACRLLVDGVQDYAIYLLDARGRVATWNPGAERLKQYRRDEIVGRPYSRFFAAGDRRAGRPRQLLDRAVAEGRVKDEGWRVRRDGSRFWAEAVLTALRRPDGTLCGFAKVTRDCTEQRQAGENLRRLNRAYAVLSEVSQAIVRAPRPQSLFEEACRIIVEQGGFRMAWIGLRDPETGVIAPVAHAGVTGRYLERLRIRLDNGPRGRGPTATALREGRPVVVNDLEHDPPMAPWRRVALRLGYRASAAFPLLVAGEARGTLNLYAAEPGLFDEEEVALFTQLARNISFALEFAREEERRRRAEEETLRRNRELTAVGEILAAIVAHLDLPTVLDRALRGALELTGLEGGTLCLVNPDAHTLELAASVNASTETIRDLTTNVIRIGDCLCGECARTGEPLILWDNASGSRFATREAARNEGIRFHAALPLPVKGRCIGVLCVFARSDARPTERSLQLLQDLCGPIALAIENARLYESERAAHAQLSQVFERVTDAFVALDRDWRYTYVNARAGEIFGRRPEDLIGRHIWTEFPEGVGQPFHRAYERALAEQQAVRFEDYYAPYDRWFENIVYPSLDGLSIYFHDVTERKRAEAALQESGEQFRAYVDQAADAIFVHDFTGRFLDVNPQACASLGYGREELLGMSVFDVETDFDLARAQAAWSQIRPDQAFTLLGHQRRKDGTTFPVEVRFGCFDLRGERCYLGLARDITERVQAEAAIRELNVGLERRVAERTAELAVARDRAEAADRTKSAFLATMSHELRTPLNSIIGFTGVLQQGLAGPLNDEQRRQLGMIRESGQHLLALINDVLDISKIEAGQLETTREPFDMRAAVEAVLRSVTPLAGRKGLRLVAGLESGVGMVVSDRRRVEQVLLNLVNNAVKFTGQGEVRIDCRVSGDRLETSVRDTGIGIRPEDMDRLFRPFMQVETGLHRSHEGTGLGLSICRNLVALLGGEIRAQSRWGEGSTFTFTLPLAG